MPRLRLGLRVEQRGSVRKHIAALQQRLERAATDMQVGCQRLHECLGVVAHTHSPRLQQRLSHAPNCSTVCNLSVGFLWGYGVGGAACLGGV